MLKILLTLCLLSSTLSAFAIDNKNSIQQSTLTKDKKL